MTQKYRTGFYAGSFNPFTVGHLDIAERALELCDRLVIGIGENIRKDIGTASQSYNHIIEIFKDNPRVEVIKYKGLTVDAAQGVGADFLVRGVRGISDFESERNLADINRELSGIETVLLVSSPSNSYVSSSMVRELESYGRDVSKWKA